MKSLKLNKTEFFSIERNRYASIIFLFPDSGGFGVNTAKDLYKKEGHFQKQVDFCFNIVKPLLFCNLQDLLYPNETNLSNEALNQILQQPIFSYPVTFTMEYSLAKLWNAWGIYPTYMIGSNMGEFVEACLANVFSLEEALNLVVKMGKIIQRSTSNKGKQDKTLIGDQLIQDAEKAHLHSPQIPCISAVTGYRLSTQEATNPGYWAYHYQQERDSFSDIQSFLEQSHSILLDMGSGQTWDCFSLDQKILSSVCPEKNQQSDMEFFFHTLARIQLLETNYQQNKKDHFQSFPEQEEQDHCLEASKGAAPHNDLERLIIRIYIKTLGIENISIMDDFFELGGTPSLALKAIEEICDFLNINLPISLFWDHITTTIALGAFIKRAILMTPNKKTHKRTFLPL